MLDRPLTLDRPALRLPDLTLVAASLGPLAFLTSWVLAGAVQPAGYSATEKSISTLADASASHPWIMTAGLVVIGCCQLVTAAGLSEMRRGARVFLAVGGVAGLGVAAFRQPAHGTTDLSTHIVFATVCIVSLAVWPWFVHARGFAVTPVRGRTVAAATVVLFALLGWVFVAGHGAGGLGTAERVETTVASLWPLVLVVALRRRAG